MVDTAQHTRTCLFEDGDDVHVLVGGDWCAGVITAARKDGTFVVTLFDSSKPVSVRASARDMRPRKISRKEALGRIHAMHAHHAYECRLDAQRHTGRQGCVVHCCDDMWRCADRATVRRYYRAVDVYHGLK